MFKQLRSLSFALPFLYFNDEMKRFQQRLGCCGIIGVLTTNKNAEQIIMDGVHLMENRGYDSAGIVTFNEQNKELLVSKYASDPIKKIDCFSKINSEIGLHKNAMSGIGHTRWATCGSKVDKNAHPHLDMNKRIALVHNGTLENYEELKQELLDKNVEFSSDTDTEVIAQLIGQYLLEEGGSLLLCIEKTLLKLQGQWGLVVMDKMKPDEMVVCRQGSPILIGYNKDSIFAASEKIAFEKYTQNYFQLQDGEVMELKLSERNSFYNQVKHRIITNDALDSEPLHLKPKAPFTTFFEMEIHEQPNSILRTLGNGARLAGSNDCSKLGGLERYMMELKETKHLLMVACGSSFNAAMAVLPTFRSLRMFESVQIIEASEFNLFDLPLEKSCVLVVSQSGETKDVVTVLNEIRNEGLITIGIVNVVGSLIASTVNCGVYLNCGREVAVAATKSYTSQVVALLLVALWLSYHKEDQKLSYRAVREKYVNSLRSLPMTTGQTIHECLGSVKKVSKVLLDKYDIFVLGKGPCYAMAREGALKIKELTYKHAEAFCSGELKHGPLALIDSSKEKHTPVILLIMDNDYFNDMNLALSEVHSRGALTIVISDCPAKLKSKDKIDHLIEIPHIGQELGWLLCVIPFQLIALELCQLMGVNPDKPRNLAKTVTVG